MLSVPIDPAFAAIVTVGAMTLPLSAIVSAPAPESPILIPAMSLQREPAPVTVTAPCEPAPLPMLVTRGVMSMTLPPFAIVRAPAPKLPILNPPLGPLTHMEPGPVTVAVPVEPKANPIEPPVLLALLPSSAEPPFSIISVPAPRPPTTMASTFVQLEPAPVTVTAPTPPGRLPIVPNSSTSVPPFWIVSVPAPFWPTARLLASALSVLITVRFGVTVLMLTSNVRLGIPASQLGPRNQSDEDHPSQPVVWAYVETVDAAKNVIVVSNAAGTNLQPVRPREVAPRRVAF